MSVPLLTHVLDVVSRRPNRNEGIQVADGETRELLSHDSKGRGDDGILVIPERMTLQAYKLPACIGMNIRRQRPDWLRSLVSEALQDRPHGCIRTGDQPRPVVRKPSPR